MIHRVVIAALMLSAAFLSGGDGILPASAAAGSSAVETKIAQAFSGLDDAGFSGARDFRSGAVKTAQVSARVAHISVAQMIELTRKIGQPVTIDEEMVSMMGIPRKPGERDVPAKARARGKPEQQMRMIAVPADPDRDYAIISNDNVAAGESGYYLTTPAGNLERAVISDGKGIRVAVGPAIEAKFRAELAYWQDSFSTLTSDLP